jgi:hypothetical protein
MICKLLRRDKSSCKNLHADIQHKLEMNLLIQVGQIITVCFILKQEIWTTYINQMISTRNKLCRQKQS